MDFSFLSEYAVPIVVGICLCMRYILKKMIPSDKAGRYIPLVMPDLRRGLNAWHNREVTPGILMGGMFSGLASIGLCDALKNLTVKKEEKDAE